MNKVMTIMKVLRKTQRIENTVKIAVAVIVTVSIVAGILLSSYSEDLNKGLADNLIRLHVIANSDSPQDQALKRDVRDVVLNYMKTKLNSSKDIEQTKYIINQNIDKMTAVAKEQIAKEGKDYSVKVMLGTYPFPTKEYGDITLPAGNYQALRIVIGKGEGANWWCVLFPPLCFVDVTHGTVPETVKKDLKATLTKEEYNIVVSADSDEDIPVKIKFKIVEFFQESKIKFAGLFSSIFGGTAK